MRAAVAHLSCVYIVASVGWYAAPRAVAQPGRHKEQISWDRNVRGQFRKYCLDCHDSGEASGNVDLQEDENPRHILQHRDKWKKVVEVLSSSQMPPEDSKPLPDQIRKNMLRFLDATLNSIDCAQTQDPGPPVLRRLTRAQYVNVIADVVGEDIPLTDELPPDALGFGFRGLGNATLTPTQVELYHQAAQKIVQQIGQFQKTKPDAFAKIFLTKNIDDLPDDPIARREHARRVLELFAFRAFRKRPETYYVNRLLRIYDRATEAGQTLDEALSHCLTAVLISPHFLLRVEQNQPDASEPYPVHQVELANRLSFLLWSRGPDDVLFELAVKGELDQPDSLSEQVQRMLADPRSEALVEQFFFQLYDFTNLRAHATSSEIYPEFNLSLMSSMENEIRLLLRDIVRGVVPLTAIVDHHSAYLDRQLAEHYAVSGVQSAQPQLVQLPDRRRGGLISSAALMTLLSDPTRTNIPRRGNYVAGQLLGEAPPPPPPGVPELEEPSGKSSKSLREIFELHRSSPDCQPCHVKIDPIGFVLENYDAIGRWRTRDGQQPIDPSATLPTGQRLGDIVDFKDYLLGRQSDINRHLARRLMIYALGRKLEPQDDCVLEAMVESADKRGDRFSAMVEALVQSRPFRFRKNSEF